jgi:hypothetical protein
MHGRLVTAALLLVLFAAPAVVRAEPRAEAKQHFDRALELVDQGSLEQAVAEFQRAYDLLPHYAVLYNLGQAYVALGRSVEAVDALSRYLEQGGDKVPAKRRTEVKNEIARQQARIALVTITVEPAGAVVMVDDTKVGTAPLADAIRLTTGDHRVTARLDGYQVATKEISVAGPQEVTVALELERVADEGPQPGRLDFACAVPDVELRLDGKVLGRSPLAAPLSVPAGPHRASFSRPGYVAAEQTVDVPARASVRVDCAVSRASPMPSEIASQLTVRPSESGARIRVDGAAYSPLDPLPRGRHIVKVTRHGFDPWEREVDLEPGANLALAATLVPQDQYRKEYETRARRQRIWALASAGGGVALEGAALGLFLWNDHRFSNWQDEQDALNRAFLGRTPDLDELDRRQVDNDELRDSIRTVDGVTIALGLTGGALLATGAILFFTGEDPNRYRAAAIVAPGSARCDASIQF